MKRIILFTKDVQIITNRGDRYCRRLLSKIRKNYNKQPGQFITVDEFSEFTGIKKELITEMLNPGKVPIRLDNTKNTH